MVEMNITLYLYIYLFINLFFYLTVVNIVCLPSTQRGLLNFKFCVTLITENTTCEILEQQQILCNTEIVDIYSHK